MLGLLTRRHLALCVGIVSVGLLIGGCSDGKDGKDGVSTAMVSGTVTNTGNNNAPVAGAVVMTDPAVPGVILVTDLAGDYSGELPIGAYRLMVEETNYEDAEETISVVAGVDQDVDFGLVPVADVVTEINNAPAVSPLPGGSFPLTATVTPMNGTTVASYAWTQSASVTAGIANPASQTCTVTLGSAAAYKAELLTHLDILDRWIVQGVNPWSLEEAGHVAFQCVVTMSDASTHTVSVDIHTDMSGIASWSPGLRTVPTGSAVLITGGEQPAYTWTFTRPGGSAATLMETNTRHPYFTPDVDGLYSLNETNSGETIEVMSGRWTGVITGIGGDDRPNATNCTGCHPGQVGDWRDTGHAEIFTVQINTGGHYGDGCFPCHTVGFDYNFNNNGIDDQGDYGAFQNAYGHFTSSGSWAADAELDNWYNMWGDARGDGSRPQVDNTARMANIQCENCHGPQNAGAHMAPTDDRVDLTSNVCAVCHGEPKRHARFQQWELSGHSNYELAIDESGSGNCSRCHTGNGFIAWEEESNFEGGNSLDAGTVTWDEDSAHPQVCVTCHDPHNVGTTSGANTNAPMRIQGDTNILEAGFQVFAAGKSAVCMTCHNSRRDFDGLVAGDARAPHHSVQTDTLQGLHAYGVSGALGRHALITDSCVTCHMSLTPPPEELSYNLGGTNHTFAASKDVCSACHGAFDASALEAKVEQGLHELEELLDAALTWRIVRTIVVPAPDWTIDIQGYDSPDNEDNIISTTITSASVIDIIHVGSSHGRMAMDIVVDGTTYYHVQLREFNATRTGNIVRNDGGVAQGNILEVDPVEDGELIYEAYWNYLWVEFDGSHGFHNPSFAEQAIRHGIETLEEYLNP